MEPSSLLMRSLFNDKSDNSNNSDHTCPVENTNGPTIQPLVGGLTYHQFSVILSGACAILSTFIIAAAIIRHSINYSNPVQQRQIIRILLLAPYICLFSFLIVWRDDVGDYLLESLDFGCSIALSSFLLFMCDLVLSHRGGFDDLFGDGASTRGAFAGNSPPKLRRVWYSVLQFFPVSVIVWIATAISLAVGTYCKQSNSVHFAHIWLQVITIISATVAIVNSIRFYSMHKAKLLQHRILLKLFTFKGIIGLNALQTFIISILAGQNILKPSKYMSYHDINTGLASFILSCEMPLFAILLFFAFPTSPYRSQSPAATSLSAIVDALNISDLLSAFVRGPMRLVHDQQRQIMRQDSVKVGINDMAVDSDYEGRRNAARMNSTV